MIQSHKQLCARLTRVNQVRQPAFERHVSDGGRLWVELGSGDCLFAATLARQNDQRILAVDLAVFAEYFCADAYENNPLVLFCMEEYSELISKWQSHHNWLTGAADKVFLIMPFPHGNKFKEEIDLFSRLIFASGELHVRTEEWSVLLNIQSQFARRNIRYRKIPFFPLARTISSFSTAFCHNNEKEIIEEGFKLI